MVLRRNSLLRDDFEGQMMEVVEEGRRTTQLPDDLKKIRKYWELREEVEDRKIWKRQFINRT